MCQLKFILSTLLMSVNIISNGQIEGIVVDSISGLPVPYINIWLEGEDVGTNSDELGAFSLDVERTSGYIVFSGIGYRSKRIKIKDVSYRVALEEDILELEGILFAISQKPTVHVTGSFKRGKINNFYSGRSRPLMRARYFTKELSYGHSARLAKIAIKTSTSVQGARFHVRIYSADERKKPADQLHSQVIVGRSRKGLKITEVDLSHLNIAIPDGGFFVAIEWLVIEENHYYEKGRDMETGKRSLHSYYAPLVGTILDDVDSDSWIYEKGLWSKVMPNPEFDTKKARQKYNVIAMELTVVDR